MTDRDETRDRFLAEVAGKVPADKVVEVHLFPPMRQGGQQSAVAVVAVEQENSATADGATADGATADGATADSATADSATAESAPAVDAESRYIVYTARYRLTQKGPDRGKWDFAMQADADAPLVTVDQVVRGVQRRSGDAEDPQRLTGEEFRALLPPAM